MNGFVNVLKPVGATASDVVVCLKRIFHEKVGHLGTLDPGAAGVLPVAVGQATRLFNFLTDKVKKYRAHFTFGKTTDTLDSYGSVVGNGSVPSAEVIFGALGNLIGEISQLPPAYSAISVGGVKAYKLARNGVEVELKPRKVRIFDIQLLRQASPDTFVFDITCSAGTYIRAIVRDLAALCGTVGYMSSLIRLSSGCFDIADSFTLDEIREMGVKCLLPVGYALADVEQCVYPDIYFADLDNGRKVPCLFENGYKKVICRNVLFGLGTNRMGTLDLQYYLKNISLE